MEMLRGKKPGFSTGMVLFAVFIVVGLVTLGLENDGHQKASIKQSANAIAVAAPVIPADDAATAQQTSTWNTYNDTGYAASSGISVKYAPGWKFNVQGVKSVGTTQNPTATINERVVYLPTAETPEEEWQTCASATSADACGAAPGDKTLNGSETTINGYSAYTASMQTGSGGIYYVTVIRGNKAATDGIPFAEFTTAASDSTTLNSYTQSMASVTFPN